MIVFTCRVCGWSGEDFQRMATDDDPTNHTHCPECESDHFTEEDFDEPEDAE